MKVKFKHAHALIEGHELPRKIKKYILGPKLNKNKIRRLLQKVKIGSPIKTMYESRKIYPYEFCPKCGCRGYYGSGNLSTYPDHWENFKCFRCKNIVGYIDNSPFIHALECAENNYSPVF